MNDPGPAAGVPVDLSAGEGRAVLWGLATEDLNVNLVAWPAGDGVDEHRNDARDVLVSVVQGELVATIDDVARCVGAGSLVVIPKGATRSLRAGDGGVRYVTVHLRRPGLQIGA